MISWPADKINVLTKDLNIRSRTKICLATLLAISICMNGLNAQTNSLSKADIPPQEINNLIQGKTYTPAYRHINGTQYLTENWRLGTLVHMDHQYENLPIWYDTYNDDLILLDWQGYGYGYIALVKQFIKEFAFDGRTFINPAYGKFNEQDLGSNFIEVIFDDQITFMIKRETKLKEVNFKYDFIRKDQKIVIKDGMVYEINNKKSLLKMVGPKYKKNVSSFIKKNISRIKEATEVEWTQVMMFYNKLLLADGIQ